MRVAITGVNLPGAVFTSADGSSVDNVHVGVQIGSSPAHLIRGDEAEASWSVDVDVVWNDGDVDFRGPAVQGKRGDRFIYLTWGNVGPDHEFKLFRRAKLMLNRVHRELLDTAADRGSLTAVVDLTGDDGGPRCARVDPPAVAWSVATP